MGEGGLRVYVRCYDRMSFWWLCVELRNASRDECMTSVCDTFDERVVVEMGSALLEPFSASRIPPGLCMPIETS